MRKYIKLYLTIMKINFSMLLAFRANFYIHSFSSLTWGAFQVITILLLTSRTGSISDWSREQLLILVVLFNVFIGFFHMLFSPNFQKFSEIFNLGEFDSILSKPLSSQFLMSTKLINYPSLVIAFVSLGILSYLLIVFEIHVSILQIILSFLSSLMGIVLLYSIWNIIMTLCIWNTKLSNLYDLAITLNGFSRFPESMFQSLKSILVVLVLPFVFVVNLPALIILNKPYTNELFATLVLTIFFFTCSIFFWNFALKSYTSASS